MATMNKGLRNSEGWNCAKPAPSQRCAPLTSWPMTGTRNRRPVKTIAPSRQSRRARALGSIETRIITGMASAIQISWR